MRRSLTAAVALLVCAATAQAQSISPSSYSATMTVGQTITINKTITLAASGANLVDIFFLADNTGSMGSVITAAKAGAGAILGAVPSGADYNFGVGRYLGDPVEGVAPSSAYAQNTALTSNAAAVQAGINSWFASGGGDTPEANFYALKQVANTAGWRTGSQRLVIWFGDAPSHTETTTEAQAIAALQGASAKVIAFNRLGNNQGIDGCYGVECNQADDIVAATGGTVTNSFTGLTGAQLAAAVNSQISLATSTLDLIFGSSLVGTGLSISFTCTDVLGCDDVTGGESRQFQVQITANTPGTYNFNVFAQGVAAQETDYITVVDTVVPEPSTYVLLATGLLGLGFVAWRRKEEEAV